MTSVKRAAQSTAPTIHGGKRFRGEDSGEVERLCDLTGFKELFHDEGASLAAKERGILRARNATQKYLDLEVQIVEMMQEARGLEPVDADALRDALPTELEANTASSLVAQCQRHFKYESAARELVLRERERLAEANRTEIHQHQLQHKAEMTRLSCSADTRQSSVSEQAQEQVNEIQEEYEEKVAALEEKVNELEEKLEEQQTEAKNFETTARDRIRALQQECGEMREQTNKAVVRRARRH